MRTGSDRPTMQSRADEMIARIGYNTASLPDRSLDEALGVGAALGLRCVELLAFEGYRHTAGELAGRFFDRLGAPEREGLARSVSGFDRVAVHAPFWDVVPFAPNPATREASRSQLRRTLEVAGEIGAATVTTHVIPRVSRPLSDFRADVIAFYHELGEVAAGAGVTVTIETGYPPEIDEFAQLVHEIAHPAVGANVDVGHLRALLSDDDRRPDAIAGAYNALLVRHLRSLGDRVFHMHLHDVQAEGVRDHRECGTGIIDYAAVFALLFEADYEGLMTFELEEADAEGALQRSIDVIAAAIRSAAADG
ncbi:MAG: sugar phosphate isomerase/epimerase family protein [Armatimonadota bacterium]|jgi:sugar phosphate isomerase/epimerase